MRDKARIEEILDLIKSIWEKDQDMRFFQLIYIVQAIFSKENNDAGKIELQNADGFSAIDFDLFNIEDDMVQDFLTDYLKQRTASDQ